MSTLTTIPPRAAADGQRARVVTDAVVSAYIHEIARAGAAARQRVQRVADDRDDVIASRAQVCASAGRTSTSRLIARKPQSARRHVRGVRAATGAWST
jgi:hypothetical protein